MPRFSFYGPSALSRETLGEKRDCRAGEHVLISISLLHLAGEVDHSLEIILSFLFKKKKLLVNNPKQNLSIYTWDRCVSPLCFPLFYVVQIQTGNVPSEALGCFVCC